MSAPDVERTPDERVRRMVFQQLRSWHRSGVRQFTRARGTPPEVAAASGPATNVAANDARVEQPVELVQRQPPAAAPVAPNRPPVVAISADVNAPAVVAVRRESETESEGIMAGKSVGLQLLRDEVAACQWCQELASTRTQTVFGVGNTETRLCFLGEAPGADEDRLGEPFVGRAGQLLTDIIEKGMRLRRSDVYILNVLKCRPPGNRTPLPDEVEHCRGYFERQIELINPEFICCLGAVAAHSLLNTLTPVGKLRGRFHEYRGRQVVVTYHPSYLLRQPSVKKDTWDDVQLLMKAMGLPQPPKAD